MKSTVLNLYVLFSQYLCTVLMKVDNGSLLNILLA